MDKYVPPFSISNKMLGYVSNIIEKITKLDNYKSLDRMPILRRNNKIHSIHASLAIEANSLSFNQVKDVINGKLVLGPQKEIQEVKNAYNAYEWYIVGNSDLLGEGGEHDLHLPFGIFIDRYDERIFSRLANKNLSINIQLVSQDKRIK